jgi:DNA invertase Pin-like site-specific DNA recombinase
MRAAAYVRISRDREGEALGVARQEQDARKLASKRGWDLVETFSDNDISASGKRKRPGWEALLDAMRTGRVQAVVAYSSSRLYRNLRDLTEFLDVVEQHGVEVATIASGNVDVATADGRMLARILASVDQAEWERGSERRRRQLADKTARGEWAGGHLPFGYLVNDTTKALEVDPAQAATIRDAAERVLRGESGASVLRRWAGDGVTTKGGNPWTAWNLRHLLTRDLPGILAETDTEALRALYARRTKGQREGRRLLTGLLVCGICGRRMIHRPQAGVRRYICLNDDNPARPRVEQGIKADTLERLIIEEAGRRHVPTPSQLVDTASPLYAERVRIVEEQDALADSELPVRMIERRGAKLQRELERIDAELRAMPADTAANSAQWAAFAQFGWADVARDPQARAWLETLIDSVTIAPAKRGANRVDPARVSIAWRDGVELAELA